MCKHKDGILHQFKNYLLWSIEIIQKMSNVWLISFTISDLSKKKSGWPDWCLWLAWSPVTSSWGSADRDSTSGRTCPSRRSSVTKSCRSLPDDDPPMTGKTSIMVYSFQVQQMNREGDKLLKKKLKNLINLNDILQIWETAKIESFGPMQKDDLDQLSGSLTQLFRRRLLEAKLKQLLLFA